MWCWRHKEPLSKSTHFYAKLSYSNFVIIHIVKNTTRLLSFVSWPCQARRHLSVGGEGRPNLPPNHPPPVPFIPCYGPLPSFGRPFSRSIALLRKLPLFSCMMDPKSGFFSRPILSKINLMFVIVFVLFCFVFVFVFVCFWNSIQMNTDRNREKIITVYWEPY